MKRYRIVLKNSQGCELAEAFAVNDDEVKTAIIRMIVKTAEFYDGDSVQIEELSALTGDVWQDFPAKEDVA